MHPVEHLLYFSTIVYHLIIPSNPIIAIYWLHVAGFGAVPAHVGFDKIEVTDETTVDSHAYIHYLHHKYFEVNYGDGLIPIDKWLGTFHDGSKDSDEQMKARFQAKKARANAKKSVGTPAE
jgi:sterol desaturase/sphingolipid hydroxylase (fatty acid hydroxylase superfamily)